MTGSFNGRESAEEAELDKELDARLKHLFDSAYRAGGYEAPCNYDLRDFTELLDKQADITRAEGDLYWASRESAEVRGLQAQVDRLTNERDEAEHALDKEISRSSEIAARNCELAAQLEEMRTMRDEWRRLYEAARGGE